jgi:signal transduction histidine kinase/FixJ family two-component response regulator
MNVTQIWRWIAKQGTEHITDPTEHKRVDLLNSFLFFAIISCLLYAATYAFCGMYELLYLCLLFVPIFATLYFIHIKGKHDIVRTTFLLMVSMYIFTSADMQGRALSVQYLLFPMAIFAVFLTDTSKKENYVLLFLRVSIPLMFLFTLEITNYDLIDTTAPMPSNLYKSFISISCVAFSLLLSALCMKLQTEINQQVINKLETEKNSLNTIFTSGLQVLIFAKKDGTIINSNNKYIKNPILKRLLDTLHPGKNIFDSIPQQMSATLKMAFENVFTATSHHSRAFIEPVDIKDKKYWLTFEATLSDNDQIALICINDITDVKNAESKIDKQREFYESILNQFPIDISVYNAQGQVTFINNKAIKDENIRKWILGKTMFEYCEYRNKPMGLAISRNVYFVQSIETRQEVKWKEAINNDKGETLYYWRNYMPMTSSSGEVKYVIGFGIDITAQTIAENELKKAKAVAEMATDAKSSFLSNMSHEIRTPMNAIVGLTELMMLDKDELSPQFLQYIEAIKFSGDNLITIINDILDFSKIEAGKIEFENIEFKPRYILEEIHRSMSFKTKEKGLSVILDIDSLIPEKIIGDPVRLSQILFNLVGNAIKFTSKGHIKVSMQMLSVEGEKLDIVFAVEDTGIGIEKDKINSIFESFTQANASTTRHFGGTGLGLSIVKKLVELQNGTLHISSEIGAGSTFGFTMPFGYSRNELTNTSQIIKIQPTHKNKLKNKKIVIVEDNKYNSIALDSLLQKWGAQTLVCRNGTEALDKLLTDINFTADIMLLDLHMPDMNGYQLTDYIRKGSAGAHYKDLPIIVVTADAFPETRIKALAAGINEYVAKPIKSNELYDKIEILTSSAAYVRKNKTQKNTDTFIINKE